MPDTSTSIAPLARGRAHASAYARHGAAFGGLMGFRLLLPLMVGNLIWCPQAANSSDWKKHLVMEQGHCNTAVALDANGDKKLDVVASFNGRVSLFTAPDWEKETVLHRFPGFGGGCIHSATIDADGDGDLDWVGTLSSQHPFWLENPGKNEAEKGACTSRPIDHEITGIHCIKRSDIDNDGRGSCNVVWYENPLK